MSLIVATEDKNGVFICPVCEAEKKERIELVPVSLGRFWCQCCDNFFLHPICNVNCDLVISGGVNCGECRAERQAEMFDKEIDKQIKEPVGFENELHTSSKSRK